MTQRQTPQVDGDSWDQRSLWIAQYYAWKKYTRQRGARYKDCRLENFQVSDDRQRDVLNRLKKFSSEMEKWIQEGTGVILAGPVGTGKDHLLTGLIYKAIAEGITSIDWTSGPQLFSELRSAFSDDIAEREKISALMHCKLLALSDIAQAGHQLTKYQEQVLFRVVDKRYSALRSTWITLNASDRNDLDELLGCPIADRLVERSHIFICNWKSYRRPLNPEILRDQIHGE